VKDRATWGRKVAALVIVAVGAAGLSAQALASSAPAPAPAAAAIRTSSIRPIVWPAVERTRRCDSGAFELSLGSVGAARGHGYAVFSLLNTSRSSCDVEGFAGVGLRRPDDRRVWLRVRDSASHGWMSPAVRRAVVHLNPGSQADFWMEWAERAGRKQGSISITAPGAARAIWLRNRLVELDAGQVTVSPVTSAVLDS
jgi:hypothetical protein